MISKAKTYLVKISAASPWTLPPELAAARPLNWLMPTWPMPEISRMPKPRAARAASQRWPFRVSLSESAAVTPTSMTTKRKSIMIAPV